LFIERRDVLGLGEVMNYHALLNGSEKLMGEIETFRDMRIDGHAPRLSGRELDAYVALGIESDHECVSAEEAEEKLRKGLRIMVREGSAARNMKALLPLMSKSPPDRFILVTDDISALDLQRGHMNEVISKAVHLGIKPEVAVRMATLNTCEYFRIEGLGAIAPGYRADIVVLRDAMDFQPACVIKDGRFVAEDGRLIVPIKKKGADVRATMNVKRITQRNFDIHIKAEDRAKINVISLIKNEIETEWITEKARVEKGSVLSDTARDVLKLCVIERHRATGRIGKGFVRGFSLRSGAIASSVAHDSHNIIVVGADDLDMYRAVDAVSFYGGGLVTVDKGKVLGSLKLPIGGLMSDRSVEEVAGELQSINDSAAFLGCRLEEPFMTLSFLTVPVIPELRLTDKGLVDVSRQRIVPLLMEL